MSTGSFNYRVQVSVSRFALNESRHSYPQIEIQVTDTLDIFGGQLDAGSLKVLNQSVVFIALWDDCEFPRQCPSQEDLSSS